MARTKDLAKPSKVLQELFSSLGSDRKMEREVLDLVHEKGLDPRHLTLNELRSIAAALARRVLKNFAS